MTIQEVLRLADESQKEFLAGVEAIPESADDYMTRRVTLECDIRKTLKGKIGDEWRLRESTTGTGDGRILHWYEVKRADCPLANDEGWTETARVIFPGCQFYFDRNK